MAKITATTNNLVIIPPKMDINLKSNIRDVKKNIRTGRTTTITNENSYSYKKSVSKKSSEKKKILLTRKPSKKK